MLKTREKKKGCWMRVEPEYDTNSFSVFKIKGGERRTGQDKMYGLVLVLSLKHGGCFEILNRIDII